ncbi:MAG: c-type cytochrome, partial [Anaerolineae bacterium]|nr:c-type cytochrome [Anaerolineae bacterium]
MKVAYRLITTGCLLVLLALVLAACGAPGWPQPHLPSPVYTASEHVPEAEADVPAGAASAAPDGEANAGAETMPVAAAPDTGSATAVAITIAEGAFLPHTVAIATGTTITWTNLDSTAYTITSGAGWFEGAVAPGESFSWQADRAGDFTYHAVEVPQMEGVVVALPGGAVAPALFNGQAVEHYYRDTCGGCHGPNREGGTGPALIPGRLEANDAFYFNTIQNGRPGTVMPAWGNFGLSEEETWMLIGFIRSEPEAENVQWEM